MLDKLAYLSAGLGVTSIAASLVGWYTERTDDDIENARAERTGIFLGLWPPTFFAVSLILFKLKERGHEQNLHRLVENLEDEIAHLGRKK